MHKVVATAVVLQFLLSSSLTLAQGTLYIKRVAV